MIFHIQAKTYIFFDSVSLKFFHIDTKHNVNAIFFASLTMVFAGTTLCHSQLSLPSHGSHGAMNRVSTEVRF
jgi:hypothetical protein